MKYSAISVVAFTLVVTACESDKTGSQTTDAMVDTSAAGDGSVDATAEVEAMPDTSANAAIDASADANNIACPASPRSGSLASLLDPTSATAIAVGEGMKLTGVVVTSPKFLVSKTASGKCTYGIFIADANANFVPYSGIVVLSNPVDAPNGGAACVNNIDLIPADAQPGDIISVTGTYSEFGPSAAACGASTPPVAPPSPAKMRQLSHICAYTKVGVGASPAPVTLTPAELQTGSATLPKWQGGLVKINTVNAGSSSSPNDASFGQFTVAGSSLRVVNTLYYRGAATAVTVNTNDAFTSIVGISNLSFCSWSIMPRTCSDMVPSSGGSKCNK